jgi:L-lactate dehydrogenase complex protein LldG
MSAREAILGKVRGALHVDASDAARAGAVAARLKNAPQGVIPERGKLPHGERVALFCTMAEKLSATIEQVKTADAVPQVVAAYLRQHNLPARLRMGGDPRLARMPWDKQRTLQMKAGASDGDDAAGISHATAGIAESGTLMMTSGSDNPTSINFLPEHHIVVIDAADIEGDLEAALGKVRKAYGKGKMPRTVNLISGPSRSADIEQKLVLGAHGPRALHVIVVGEAGQ